MIDNSIFKDVQMCGVIGFQFHDSFSLSRESIPITNSSLNLYVCTDLCQQSFVNDSMLPVLTRLNINVNNDSAVKDLTIAHPIYIPIVQTFKESIRIYILGDDNALIPINKGPTKVTLHLL